ncbi:response regulator [Mucilaginibacter mali]|uniref:Response regulator n=1 Tax=Mucilaginibacter mali TaxID=2740462 RepID=A0A7D4PXA5_9SPHI|nr:response regulator [Mucilaginibacter mali]QKJ32323.1 response regulator [Mucilaginibacter mali]
MPKLNIYIVEDEPLISRILKQTVMRLGHSVCGSATSYHDAIDGLRQADADLIITDIMLEGDKTGVDLAHYINAHLKIPFIFQSSVIDEVIIDAALKTGPLMFVPKPLDRYALSDAISATYAKAVVYS